MTLGIVNNASSRQLRRINAVRALWTHVFASETG